LKHEVSNHLKNYNHLSSDFKLAERNVTMLTADKTALQQQVLRIEVLERELHQAKWQVTSMEQQLRDSTADANFRLSQAQTQIQQAQSQAQQVQAQAQAQIQQAQAQVQAQVQAHNRAMSSSNNIAANMPLPMPMSMPIMAAAPMPTYSPAYVPPPPAPSRHNPPAQYNGYQPPASTYGSGYSAPASTHYTAPSYSGYPAATAAPPGHTPSSLGHRRTSSSAGPVVDSTASAPFGTASKSPFANEVTSAQINHVFDDLDRNLTLLMTEKTNLQDESEK
jgi:hypothetical protein